MTFFVQHFLGLAGLPRRVPDYPDSYYLWNTISSFGSLISLVSTLVFLYGVYKMFVSGVPVARSPWAIKEFFGSSKPLSTTLEWELTSPPVLHTFNNLPCVVVTNLSPNKVK